MATNRHRLVAALVFDRLCRLSGLPATELCLLLEDQLAREQRLQPSTLRTWRSGQVAVPLEAMLVVAEQNNFRFPGLEVLLLGDTVDDPDRRVKALAALVARTTKLVTE